MKKMISLPLLLAYSLVWGQKDGKDNIDYYTDSQIKHSRFSLVFNLNPNYTDRRLINDEIPSGGTFDLLDEKSDGSFQLNCNLSLFYVVRTCT